MHSFFQPALRLIGLGVALLIAAPCAHSQQPGGPSQNTEPKRLPVDTILVRGAWSSASDLVIPVPEGGTLAGSVYTNEYFGFTYALPSGWIQKYSAPPPSDSGYYVLAQFRPADTSTGTSPASIFITAQDLFFSLTPAANALELINYTRGRLQPDYKVERLSTQASVANRSFIRFDYYSPAAGLHWRVLATEIRCHVIEFVFTGRDTKLLDNLVENMNRMKLPAEANPRFGTGGDNAPVCEKDYARGENVTYRVDPVFSERRFNAIPVRIVIDKEGKVKHIHFPSAFPDQARSITDALWQWRFKAYLRDGQPTELETGILFGHAPRVPTSAPQAVNE